MNIYHTCIYRYIYSYVSHIFISCKCTYVHIYNSSYTEAPRRHKGEQSWTQLALWSHLPTSVLSLPQSPD